VSNKANAANNGDVPLNPYAQAVFSHPTLQTAASTMTDPRTYALWTAGSAVAGTAMAFGPHPLKPQLPWQRTLHLILLTLALQWTLFLAPLVPKQRKFAKVHLALLSALARSASSVRGTHADAAGC
jgi:hypothetical protein